MFHEVDVEQRIQKKTAQIVYDYGKSDTTEAVFYKLSQYEAWVSKTSEEKIDKIPFEELEAFFGTVEAEYYGVKDTKKARGTGQIYYPPSKEEHTWLVNLNWVLGLIHAGRNVRILSQITHRNLLHMHSMERNDLKNLEKGFTECIDKIDKFSAFTREIVALMKVGYTVEIKNCEVRLEKKNLKNLNIIEIVEIDPSIDDVKKHIRILVLEVLKAVKYERKHDDMMLNELLKELNPNEDLNALSKLENEASSDAVLSLSDFLKKIAESKSEQKSELIILKGEQMSDKTTEEDKRHNFKY
ncbi:MAG: hypothetical protein ACNA7Y_00150 [Gammaproteobacteria bacterium]